MWKNVVPKRAVSTRAISHFLDASILQMFSHYSAVNTSSSRRMIDEITLRFITKRTNDNPTWENRRFRNFIHITSCYPLPKTGNLDLMCEGSAVIAAVTNELDVL